jgi:hypothetical protein
MIEFISNKIIFMLLVVVMIANTLNVLAEPLTTQKQFGLESLEITLSLQNFAHACLWGSPCDSCRESCDVNETVANATNFGVYYPENKLLNITMANTQFPSSFNMILDMFIAGDPIGSKFNPNQELIFLKIGGKPYNHLLRLDTKRLHTLRLAEVQASHSMKFSFEFYRQNLRNYITGGKNETAQKLDKHKTVTDPGCDFSWVRDTHDLHHEVTSLRCANVVLFDASHAFHTTAENNLYVTLCIIGVLVIGGTLIFADLRVLFEPLEQLSDVATLCTTWLQKKREAFDKVAQEEAKRARRKAAEIARKAATEVSAHPMIDLEFAPKAIASEAIGGGAVAVSAEDSDDGAEPGLHALSTQLFEMAEETRHGLDIGTAALLLLCESMQDLTGVQLSHPQQQMLLLKQGAVAMLHIVQEALDHVCHETLTWRAMKKLIATACELCFPPAQSGLILQSLAPFSHKMDNLTTGIADCMRTLNMQDQLVMSNKREGIHLPKIDMYMDQLTGKFEQLAAMCLMAELQFEMTNALRVGLGDGHADKRMIFETKRDRSARMIQRRWRTRQEQRRWSKLFQTPLSRFTTKLRALLLPTHFQVVEDLQLAPAFAMLSELQKRRLYGLVLHAKNPSEVKSMAEVRDFAWMIFEQFFHDLLASGLQMPQLSARDDPVAAATLRTALYGSDGTGSDSTKWLRAAGMVQGLIPLIGPDGTPTCTAGTIMQQVLHKQGISTETLAPLLANLQGGGAADDAAMAAVTVALSSMGVDATVMQGVKAAYADVQSKLANESSADFLGGLPPDAFWAMLSGDHDAVAAWVKDVGAEKAKELLQDRSSAYGVDVVKLIDGDAGTMQDFMEGVLQNKLESHGVAKGVLSDSAMKAFKMAVAEAKAAQAGKESLAAAGSAVATAVDNVSAAVGGFDKKAELSASIRLVPTAYQKSPHTGATRTLPSPTLLFSFPFPPSKLTEVATISAQFADMQATSTDVAGTFNDVFFVALEQIQLLQSGTAQALAEERRRIPLSSEGMASEEKAAI